MLELFRIPAAACGASCSRVRQARGAPVLFGSERSRLRLCPVELYPASDEKRNSVWSGALGPGGDFDTDVRRDSCCRTSSLKPEDMTRARRSHPVSDISLPAVRRPAGHADRRARRVRNLGLGADPFARRMKRARCATS